MLRVFFLSPFFFIVVDSKHHGALKQLVSDRNLIEEIHFSCPLTPLILGISPLIGRYMLQ